MFDKTEHIEGFDRRRAPDLVGVKDLGLMLGQPSDEVVPDDAAIDVSIEEEGDVHGTFTGKTDKTIKNRSTRFIECNPVLSGSVSFPHPDRHDCVPR